MFSEFFNNIFYSVGVYVIIFYLYDHLKSVFSIIFHDLFYMLWPDKKLTEKYGTWAVVTGSTQGIGRCYANELAKRGVNIVLIAIYEDELITVAKEIEETYNVKTKWIQVDFTKGIEVYKYIETELADIPVGILVNNVGIASREPGRLVELADWNWNILQVNCGACTMMSQMMIKKMLANGKGAIINIGSSTELLPLPEQAIYAATKTFVRYLTIALQHELAGTNIEVQLVTPMFVKTQLIAFSKNLSKGGFFIPSPEDFLNSAIQTLGKTNRTTGYWPHAIQYAIISLVPLFIRFKTDKPISPPMGLMTSMNYNDIIVMLLKATN